MSRSVATPSRRSGSRPTGTVTFLFTDIEGSTKLLQRVGDAWDAVLAEHHRLLRSTLLTDDGYESATAGDGFLIVYPTATAAVAAAAAAQRALAAAQWSPGVELRVRMGLHSGEGRQSGGQYIGLDVHRAARIAAAAHGGQVLVSDTTRALAEGSLPDPLALRDLGEFRLKDLARREHLYQLVIVGLPADFPPPASLSAVPGNLPTQLTSFLGRRRELDAILGLLATNRLVTLIGPGGTGKTRLGLQVAAEAGQGFSGGVYFVPLATIEDPELVASAIAHVIGIQDAGARPPEERLLEHLRDREVLLLLDNFEQITDAAPLLGRLLTGAQQLKVIVTSRSPLHVSAEHEFPVPPLQLPDPQHLPSLESLSQYEAVALFIERALSVKPDFAVTNENAPAVAEITARLDGLPLAIELAAARVKLLSPKALLARLEHRLSVLDSGSRDLPARQRTLRGAIAWSYDLLDDPGRPLFARFSVFRGGASIEDVAAVCAADGDLGGDTFGLLATLVDQSLLRQEASEDEPRFGMLETVREYAAERLAESGETDAIRGRHADVFLALAEEAEAELTGNAQTAWLDRLEREHDNIRAAIAWYVDHRQAELALRFGAAIWRFWQMRGHLREAAERLDRVLALEADCDKLEPRARGLEAAGGIAYWMGNMPVARAYYERSLELRRQLGEPRGIAEALYNLAFPIFIGGTDNLKAVELLDAGLALYRQIGDRRGIAKCLWAQASQDETQDARPRLLEAMSIFRELEDRFNLGWVLRSLGIDAIEVSEFDAARSWLRESLSLFAEASDISGITVLIGAMADLATGQGALDRAMTLRGAASALQASSGTDLAESLGADVEAPLEPAGQLREGAAREAWQRGLAMTREEAVAYALSTSE
jgi:predicted ATPase/class 3 adenylate cyclase